MLPYFYQALLEAKKGAFVLDEVSSHHCTQVLRMKPGEELLLTNGKGLRAVARINIANRKHTEVNITSFEVFETQPAQFSLAIAFTKNKSRNEWLLEKITELGVSHIYPLQTQRSERYNFNFERLNTILISAMLQSQQVFLPQLHEVQKIKSFVADVATLNIQKCIAHCEDEQNRNSFWQTIEEKKDVLVMIGPEGDFSPEEIENCLSAGFNPVSLGINRLRTETAGLYACTVFNAKNYG